MKHVARNVHRIVTTLIPPLQALCMMRRFRSYKFDINILFSPLRYKSYVQFVENCITDTNLFCCSCSPLATTSPYLSDPMGVAQRAAYTRDLYPPPPPSAAFLRDRILSAYAVPDPRVKIHLSLANDECRTQCIFSFFRL